jgi:hypothetical protein
LLTILDGSANFADAIGRCVANAAENNPLPDKIILAAHSAAGAYLPVIAAGLSQKISAYIFVDARLPQNGATLDDQDSSREREQRKSLATNGLLPPWSQWFGEEVMEEILPRKEQREQFTEELRPIPLRLFHEKINYPSKWPDAPCAYLCLSEFYKPLAAQAATQGWPTKVIYATHLYPVPHPHKVAQLLIDLIRELQID